MLMIQALHCDQWEACHTRGSCQEVTRLRRSTSPLHQLCRTEPEIRRHVYYTRYYISGNLHTTSYSEFRFVVFANILPCVIWPVNFYFK